MKETTESEIETKRKFVRQHKSLAGSNTTTFPMIKSAENKRFRTWTRKYSKREYFTCFSRGVDSH